MDNPIFALLDDIAETARGGNYRDVTHNEFDDSQLLDNESQYLTSQTARRIPDNNGRTQGQRSDENLQRTQANFHQPQASRHFRDFQKQAPTSLTLPSNSSRQIDNDSRLILQRQQLMDDPYVDRGLTHPRQSQLNLSQYSWDGATQSHTSSPPAAGLPSSPAFRASQRKYDHRSGHHKPSQVASLDGPSDTSQSNVRSSFQSAYHNAGHKAISLPHAPRVVQGIEIRSTHELPDSCRSIFKFPNFNAVQSKCFETIYETNDNFVLSSPTGSGKTAIFELAICRLLNSLSDREFKIVYQAPTKSLCSERQRDWLQKFRPLGLECAELTGDTDMAQLKNVQNASIIVTTPEKWDSMTRKWKDHVRLMKMIKLFLIDEVHMLKEERGAVLEVVVSRMKSIGSDVRFIALSASIPNSDDIATWLGRNFLSPQLPAIQERFGEEFRPVLLQKHVVGYQSSGNDFAFEKTMDAKLPEIITKYSHRKPIMVFCFTRKSCEHTAQSLANWWSAKPLRERYWEGSRRAVLVSDSRLKGCVSAAVAFHHAGLGQDDRLAVEKGFLHGDINVICCTGTLAVGVNLPCHLVVIKNTVTYTSEGLKEYSDLEVMQMLGRAGRPQFDNTAVAVIMTRQEKVRKYEKMVSGQDILESCLHRNLIDHLNAEIVLDTVMNLSSAKKWLSGTFLCVRLRENPEHYRLDGDSYGNRLEDRLGSIATRDIQLLQDYGFVRGDSKLSATEFGDAMARYYIHFETAKNFLKLPSKAKMSDMLSALAQAKEFKELRFRSNEKSCYKELNRSPSIRFPIPVNLDLPVHKISLIIQSQLGGVDLATDEKTAANKFQYTTDVHLIFQHVHRLIRCIVDFSLYREDSVSLRNALALCRSLGARCWDDSPLQLRQLNKIGIAAVRKLVNAGIKSIEELENTEAHRIEAILNRAPPFGLQMLDSVKAFPKPRVTAQIVGKPVIKAGQGATVNISAEVGFLNEHLPVTFHKKAVYVVFLAETSDGRKIEFCRISAKKLNKGTDIRFSVLLTDPMQSIACHVMCDEFAGTLRSANLKPIIPSEAFPKRNENEKLRSTERPAPNSAKRRSETPRFGRVAGPQTSDEFEDGDLDDNDLIQAVKDIDTGFQHIDSYSDEPRSAKRKNVDHNSHPTLSNHTEAEWRPRRLKNGKWACNHACKDKSACRHMCCREGLEKPPKAPKKVSSDKVDKSTAASTQRPKKFPTGQTTLNLEAAKKSMSFISTSSSKTTELDLTEKPQKLRPLSHAPGELKQLEKLDSKTISSRSISTPTFFCRNAKPPQPLGFKSPLSFLSAQEKDDCLEVTSDSEDSYPDSDLPGLPDILAATPTRNSDKCADIQNKTVDKMENFTIYEPDDTKLSIPHEFGESDSLLDATMVSLADSEDIQACQPATRRRHYADIDSDDDKVFYRNTSATAIPNAPKAPCKVVTTALPSSEDLVQEPVAPYKRCRVGTFLEKRGENLITLGSTYIVDSEEQLEPMPNRVKTVTEADKENDFSSAMRPFPDVVGHEMTELNHAPEVKYNDEIIDEWFTQEFGQYVDFV